MLPPVLRLLAISSLTMLLGGCISSGGAPIRYYLIDPGAMTRVEVGRAPAVEIVDLRLPQYLDRFNIATRSGDGELRFSADHQWAESLRKNLTRVLAENLGNALGTANITAPPRHAGSEVDVRLAVFIEQFEQDTDGSVVLRARWQVSEPKRGETLLITARRFTSPVLAMRDYPAVVAAMREQFAALSQVIAQDIAGQAGT